MADVQFIQSNPAVDEYNRANKVASDQQTADLNNQKLGTENLITQAGAPTKLRFMNAQADLETANAGKASAELPYAGPQAAAHLAQTRASTGLTSVQTAKANAELPYAGPEAAARVEQTQASTRSSNAAAKNAEMQGFYKSLDALNNGDVAGAQAIAAQSGQTLPPEVINNTSLRQTVTAIAKRAQEIYPNRPANQQTYIAAQMEELHKQVQAGQHPDAVMQPYVMPPGAPAPQEVGGAHANGETERIIANLQEDYRLKNPGKELPYADAVSMAHRGSRVDEGALQRERLASSAARADGNFSVDPMGTLEKWRGQYGLPSKIPQGQGTRQAPFVATTQDQVDWFKANAKPGQVLSVNGQLVTK